MIMKCIHCGKEISYVNYVTENDEPLCDECYLNNYTTCKICGGVIPRNNGTMCEKCSDIAFKRVMNSYGTKICNRFKNRTSESKKSIGCRYFGYEMEYSYTTGAHARIAFSKLYKDKLIYNKSDSSLHGGGVEIVTIPMTRNNLIKLFNDMDFKTFKNLSGRDYSDGAGVHIHVSRNTISPIDIMKLSLLFNSNRSRIYSKYIYFLSGRIKSIDNNNLTWSFNVNRQQVNDNFYKVGSTPLQKIMDIDYVGCHGVALNLANKNTIEFRLFKSTMDKEQLISYLEFVEKAIEFCEKNTINMISIPNFISYLRLTSETKWLKERLDDMYKYYEDVFKVCPVDYTMDKWMDLISGISLEDLQDALTKLRFIDMAKIDFSKPINKTEIDSIYANSMIDKRCENKIVNKVLDLIKNNLVEEILNK